MNVLRMFVLTALAMGLAGSASTTFAQSLTAPAGIPSDTAPGGQVRRGIASPVMERQQGPAFAPYEDLTAGSIRPSRWSGIHRPIVDRPIK